MTAFPTIELMARVNEVGYNDVSGETEVTVALLVNNERIRLPCTEEQAKAYAAHLYENVVVKVEVKP